MTTATTSPSSRLRRQATIATQAATAGQLDPDRQARSRPARLRRDQDLGRGDRGEDRRTDQPEVARAPAAAGARCPGRGAAAPGRIGHQRHQDRQADQAGGHDGSPSSSRVDSARPVSRAGGPLGSGRASPARRTARRCRRRRSRTRLSQASPIRTAQATPAAAATTSRRPVDRPTARPAIAAGKTTSRPRTAWIGNELAAEQHADDRGQVPRNEGRADRGDPVAGRVDPPEPLEVDAGQGERLVGQEVGHDRPFERAASCAATAPAPRSRAGDGR